MRIITVLDSYPPDLNGGAYFTHRLAYHLKKQGQDVLVICPSRSVHQGYSDYEGVHLYRVRSWPIFLYKNFRICWPFFIKKRIKDVIEQFKPDVIHLQGKFFLGGICFRLGQSMNIPMVATNHFMPENFFHYTHLPASFKPWFARLCWRPIIDMLHQVNAITTPTKKAVDLLVCVDSTLKVRAISCGVDLNRFRPLQDATLLRQQLNIPNKPTLLYCGRLDKEKNIPYILDAFTKACSLVDAHCVITGTGAYQAQLKKRVQELGIANQVTFTGYLSDAQYPCVYGLADCFVIASTAELQSIVTLEAIASGLPILAIDAMALPELVTHGINGFLFPEENVQLLSDYIVQLLSNPEKAKAMGEASRQLALTHDIENTILEYETLYKEISKT